MGTTFFSPFEQYAELNGHPVRIVRTITEPDDDHDAEVLPMYVVETSDGRQIEAWPEEVGR
jgi:hypothetical protein